MFTGFDNTCAMSLPSRTDSNTSTLPRPSTRQIAVGPKSHPYSRSTTMVNVPIVCLDTKDDTECISPARWVVDLEGGSLQLHVVVAAT